MRGGELDAAPALRGLEQGHVHMTVRAVAEHLGNRRARRDLGESAAAGHLQEVTGHMRGLGWDPETTTGATLNS